MAKGQITIFILVGVILIIMFGALYMFFGQGTGDETELSLQKSQEETYVMNQVRTYITKCLDTTTEEAIQLIAEQGGFIYQGQGTNVRERNLNNGDSFSKIEHVTYNNLTYGIKDIFYSTEVPRGIGQDAPNYPCTTRNLNCKFDTMSASEGRGYFGIVDMPPLYSSEESILQPSSLQKQLKSAVEQKMDNCLNYSIFAYEIEEGERNLTVELNQNSVEAKLRYPITIITPVNRSSEIVEYTTTHPYRLKKMALFAKSIAQQDTTDILFDIETDSLSDPNYWVGFEVRVVRDYVNSDDLIILNDTDPNFRPFGLKFLRQNRRPALNFIKNKSNEYLEIIVIDPKAHDPDEDDLFYYYEGDFSNEFRQSLQYRTTNRTASINATQHSGTLSGYLSIIPHATDGILVDYQPVTMRIEQGWPK